MRKRCFASHIIKNDTSPLQPSGLHNTHKVEHHSFSHSTHLFSKIDSKSFFLQSQSSNVVFSHNSYLFNNSLPCIYHKNISFNKTCFINKRDFFSGILRTLEQRKARKKWDVMKESQVEKVLEETSGVRDSVPVIEAIIQVSQSFIYSVDFPQDRVKQTKALKALKKAEDLCIVLLKDTASPEHTMLFLSIAYNVFIAYLESKDFDNALLQSETLRKQADALKHLGSKYLKKREGLLLDIDLSIQQIYHMKGHHQSARDQIVELIPRLKTHFGPRAPEVARAEGYLGLCDRALGRTKSAQTLLQRAVSTLAQHKEGTLQLFFLLKLADMVRARIPENQDLPDETDGKDDFIENNQNEKPNKFLEQKKDEKEDNDDNDDNENNEDNEDKDEHAEFKDYVNIVKMIASAEYDTFGGGYTRAARRLSGMGVACQRRSLHIDAFDCFDSAAETFLKLGENYHWELFSCVVNMTESLAEELDRDAEEKEMQEYSEEEYLRSLAQVRTAQGETKTDDRYPPGWPKNQIKEAATKLRKVIEIMEREERQASSRLNTRTLFRVEKSRPVFPYILALRGHMLDRLEEHGVAKELYERAMALLRKDEGQEIHPGHQVSILMWYGVHLRQSQNNTKSIEIVKEALRIADNSDDQAISPLAERLLLLFGRVDQ